VTRHYLEGELLQDIAHSMGVTQARVSQIATEAVNAMRSYLATQYEGVPVVAQNAPGKRTRAAYLELVGVVSTWQERMEAADDATYEEPLPVLRAM
jgi:hypothetical protein